MSRSVRRRRGVALLTILIFLGVAASLATGIMERSRAGARLAANSEVRLQAQWYAIGVETLVAHRIAALSDQQARAPGLGGLLEKPLAFPVEAGEIAARVVDAGQCFNLNSVVEGALIQYQRRQAGVDKLLRLMLDAGVRAEAAPDLAAALVDWIDTDAEVSPGGAEDDHYLKGPQPYRTAGSLLASTSELRMIRGFTPEIIAQLRGRVCALPTAGPTPLNLNALSPDKAELLAIMSGGALDEAAAAAALRRRPAQGWRDVADFWTLAGASAGEDADAAAFTVRSRFFQVEAAVRVLEAEVSLISLLDAPQEGTSRVLSRAWDVET